MRRHAPGRERGRPRRAWSASPVATVVAVAVAALATAALLAGTVLAWQNPDAGTGALPGPPGRASAPADPDQGRASGSAPPPSGPADPSGTTAPAGGAGGGASGGPPTRSAGWPSATNTGVPPGTRLTVVEGDQLITADGQVVSGLDIHGFVRIRARNVTLRNSVVRGGTARCNSAVVFVEAGASATIEDVEIAPAERSPCLDGVWATSTTMRRLNIHDTVDGVKAFDDTTLLDSWVHDLSWFDSDPNQSGGATHNDAVQTYEGNRHVLLRHNTLDAGRRGNAAYQVTQDGGRQATDLRVEGNLLDGGGCTLNFSHKGGPTPMTGISVVGNRFGRGSAYQCPILLSTKTVLTRDSGNVWDDTGRPIPAPQRHD